MKNKLFESIFTVKKPIIGMIHVWAVKKKSRYGRHWMICEKCKILLTEL